MLPRLVDIFGQANKMSTRSVLGFIYTLEGMRNAGINVDRRLGALGMEVSSLAPDSDIERSHELRLYSALLEGVDDPLAGLKSGSIHGIAGYGPLSMLLVTCQTAWEALQTGVRYQALTYLFGTLSLLPGEKTSVLAIRPVPLPETCRRFVIDRDLVGTFQLIRDIQTSLGVTIQPLGIALPYPKPREYRAYEQHFGCAVQFGGEESSIIFRNEDAMLAFPGANRTVNQMYRNQCDLLLQRRESEATGLAEQVAAHLALFVQRFPAAEEVARTFGMSERSLRRKLGIEGTSFRQVLDDVRLHKATAYLRDTSHSVESVAQMLGYAESAAFNHAFQRWTGRSPRAFRAGT